MIKLVNGAKVLACVLDLIDDNQACVLCLHRGEFVIWSAHLPTDGHTNGHWYCTGGSYCESLEQARKVFSDRSDWYLSRRSGFFPTLTN